MEKMLRLKKIRVKNTQEVDIYVRDAFGKEHILWPTQEKKIILLQKGKKDANRSL